MRWLLVGLLCVSLAHAAEWDPARTSAFVVGVLKWDHKDWSSFPKKGRRDAELVRTLKARGVARVAYLKDKAATLAAIRARFAALLRDSRKGDFLIFYYCGHGFQSGGATYLANVDSGDARASWWPVAEVVDAIERDFRGDRALLLADCCHSGALIDVVKRRSARLVAYGVIASSTADVTSTGNWTFTQSVLDALGGEGRVDLDANRQVTLAELAHYSGEEMRVFEKQDGASVFTKYFPADMTIARVRPGAAAERAGERVEVKYDGQWWAARIVKVAGKQALIRWMQIGYDRKRDQEWVPLDTVRPLTAQ